MNPLFLKVRVLLFFVLVALVYSPGCGEEGGGLRITSQGALSLSENGQVVFRSASPLFQVGFGSVNAFMAAGMFHIEENLRWENPYEISVITRRASSCAMRFKFPSGVTYYLECEKASHWWKFLLRPDENSITEKPAAVKLRISCTRSEHFLGFGERSNTLDQRGNVLENWTSEDGIGKAPLPLFPIVGSLTTTHFAIPFYLSTRGYGFLLDDTHYARFDVCRAEENILSVVVWNADPVFYVFPGHSTAPLEIISSMTELTGRAELPPEWVFAPQEWAKHSQQNVMNRADALRAHGIPASVMWYEDWNWPGTDYPDLQWLNKYLHQRGFAAFAYQNPFLPEPSPEEEQYAIRTPEGEVYLFPYLDGPSSLMDLTNYQTLRWYERQVAHMAALGFDGGMVDFGEWVPFDARFSDGRSGAELHNLYPNLWGEINKKAWEKYRGAGNYAFYMRAGFTGIQSIATFVWAGDQLPNFDRQDGIGSIVPMGLSLGISGVPFYGHDIAGYTSIFQKTTKELFFRWVELGAFSPIMRAHGGYTPYENWHAFSDTETTEFYRNLCTLRVKLFPYIYAMAKLSSRKGYPMMRALYLHWPQDDETLKLDQEFMLGDFLLVAPVVREGARKVDVYLPRGRWFDFFTNEVYEGGHWIRKPVELDEIAVFVREGAVLPMLSEAPDTLRRNADADIKTLADVENKIEVHVYAYASGFIELADGTVIENEYNSSFPASFTVQESENITVDKNSSKSVCKHLWCVRIYSPVHTYRMNIVFHQ